MKKLILYLGLLCVLFSMPQLAHAADLELYITGIDGWNFTDDWKFTSKGNNEYELTVTKDTWKSTSGFKVSTSSWTEIYGANPSIEANTTVYLSDASGQDVNKEAHMTEDVPVDAVVTYNSYTHAFKVSYKVVENPNQFKLEPGALYLVGNHLNNWRTTPEYRIVETREGSGEYLLENFVIVGDSEFAVRIWSDNSTYKDYACVPGGTDATYNFHTGYVPTSYTAMAETTKHMKWIGGATMFSVRVKKDKSTGALSILLEPNFAYPSRVKWPEGTKDKNGNTPVFGVPWLAFVGDELQNVGLGRRPNQDRSFGGRTHTTPTGWESAWVQTRNGAPVEYKEIPGADNKGEQKGDVLYNTIWPPRENITFTSGALAGTSSYAISFTPDRGGVYGTTLTKNEAKEMLRGGKENVKLYTDADVEDSSWNDIPDGWQWTKYTTTNATVNGKFKLWSGWGGELVGDDEAASDGASNDDKASALWSYHPNWGLGVYDPEKRDKSVGVTRNNVYKARVSVRGNNAEGGANMDFGNTITFREFNFYVAYNPTSTADSPEVKYYFSAQLEGGDPHVRISKTAGGGVKGECEILTSESGLTGYNVTGYTLSLSADGGEKFTPVPGHENVTFDTPITIDQFNANKYAYTTADGLPTGVYQFRLDVRYQNVTDPKTGYSDQITLASNIKAVVDAHQRTETGEDGETLYSFDITVDADLPGVKPIIRKMLDHYELTVDKTFSTITYAAADGTVKTVAYADGKKMYSIECGTDNNFPTLTVKGANPEETVKFTVTPVFKEGEDITAMESDAAEVTFTVPECALLFGTDAFEFANDKNIDESNFLSQNLATIQAAKNWLNATATVKLPAVTSDVWENYNVEYYIQANNGTGWSIIGTSAGTFYYHFNQNKPVDKQHNFIGVPFTGIINADGTLGGDAVYTDRFRVITQYTGNAEGAWPNTFQSDAQMAEEYTLYTDDMVPAPRNDEAKRASDGTEGNDYVDIDESYAERFHGHHAYWQDAYVAVRLDNKPVKGALVGSLRKETRNGKYGYAPVEAGGMYNFANVVLNDPRFYDAGKPDDYQYEYLWYNPMPAGHEVAGHDHYKDGKTVDSFYAGHGQNQFFCTVNHANEPSAYGFGEILKGQVNDFYKNFDGKPDVDASAAATDFIANNEMIWYNKGYVYRRVHHVNHEGRYFGKDDKYVPHYDPNNASASWAFDLSQYEDMTATLYYSYNILTDWNALTMEDPDAPAPSAVVAREAAAAPAGEYKAVATGAGYPIGFDGAGRHYYNDGTTTGIENVVDDNYSDNEYNIEYYDLQGRKVENPAAGIYIYRQGSRTGKVLIK